MTLVPLCVTAPRALAGNGGGGGGGNFVGGGGGNVGLVAGGGAGGRACSADVAMLRCIM